MKLQFLVAVSAAALIAGGCRGRAPESAPPPTPAAAPQTAPAAPPPPPAPAVAAPAPAAVPTPRQSTSPAPTARAAARRPRAPAPVPATGPPAIATTGVEPVPAVVVPRTRELTVPGGTILELELITAVASDTAQVETPVRARLLQPIRVDDAVALPGGATLGGGITEVERSGRVQGRARLVLAFDHAEVNGMRVALRTEPLTFEAESTKGEDAAKIGGGAVGGAIIGGILGGAKGAAKGAAIGGAAGTGVVIGTRGDEVRLSAGTRLAAHLAAPLTVTVPR